MERMSTSIGVLAILLALGTAGCESDSGAQKSSTTETAESSQQKESGEMEESGDKEAEGDEHPGDEHPGGGHQGDEHPGEGEEHPGEGEEHPGNDSESSKESFDAAQIKEAMNSHIDSETAAEKKGVFQIDDPKTGDSLELKFVKIHDPVRKISGKGYFACTDFHVAGAEEKVYDLDFWLNPKDGELKVTKTKIHKHPVEKDGSWEKEARYTFENDEIVKID